MSNVMMMVMMMVMAGGERWSGKCQHQQCSSENLLHGLHPSMRFVAS
jgi:hypothetical protein